MGWKSFFALLLLLSLAHCKTLQLTIFFYHYEVLMDNCNNTVELVNVTIAQNGTPTPVSDSTNGPSNNMCLNHLQIGPERTLGRWKTNPLAVDFTPADGMDMFVEIMFMNVNNSEIYTIIVNLTVIKLRGAYTTPHRYKDEMMTFSLDLSIQKNCSRNVTGSACDEGFPLTSVQLGLIILAVILVFLVVFIIVMVILGLCKIRAVMAKKEDCRPKWFNRYFIDPRESREESGDLENGNSTRSRLQTRLTLINGSVYFWKSAGRKSKDKKKKSSMLDVPEGHDKNPKTLEARCDSKDTMDGDQPVQKSLTYEDHEANGTALDISGNIYEFDHEADGTLTATHADNIYEDHEINGTMLATSKSHTYEDHEADGTSLATSHTSGMTNDKAAASAKADKKDQSSSASPRTKSEAKEETGSLQGKLKLSLNKKLKQHKSRDVEGLEKKAKRDKKQKKSVLDEIPEDENAASKKNKKKKNKNSSRDAAEGINVVKNIGASFEEKSKPDSTVLVSAQVERSSAYEEHEADGTKLETAQHSSVRSGDVKSLITRMETTTTLQMVEGSSNRLSAISEYADDIILLPNKGNSSVALLGRPVSPKPKPKPKPPAKVRTNLSMENIPKDESTTSTKNKKKLEKKKSTSSTDANGAEENSIVQNMGAITEPIAVLVESPAQEKYKADLTAESKKKARLSADMKGMNSRNSSSSSMEKSEGFSYLSRTSVISESTDEVTLVTKGRESSTALLGQLPSSKPDLKPVPSPKKSTTPVKKEAPKATFGGRIKASVGKAFGQRESIDLDELERKMRENAKQNPSQEEEGKVPLSKKDKKAQKKMKKEPRLSADSKVEDRDGYVSVDMKPINKPKDDAVGNDGYVDIKTIARRKTMPRTDSPDHDDGYVKTDMPINPTKSGVVTLQRGSDGSFIVKPNMAYSSEKFSTPNAEARDESTAVKTLATGDSRASTPDDYPYEYIREQSIIKLRMKK